VRSAHQIVEDEVRELVRQRGIDPVSDRAAARTLVEQVVADYDERAMTGTLPVLADRAATTRAVFDGVAGLGPLQPFLDDPDVEEIWINGPGRVFVARGGRSELTTVILTDRQVQDLTERMLTFSGRRVDLSTPFVDALLPDGSRLHVAIPDVTRRHWAVNIRKFVVRASSLEELVGLDTLSTHAARFLDAAVAAGLNVLVSGGTQAGKTTLLNCLASAIPGYERIVSCEEVFELRLPAPDWVALQTRQPNLEGAGEIPLRRLVVEALRMRPSRIIVGEVRQAEALDLLLALNAGLPGMASVHANSARQAIAKLCVLPLLAGENVTSRFVVPTVAGCVDLVVHLQVDRYGHRRVREIVAVSGRVEGSAGDGLVVETADVFTSRGGADGGGLVRAGGYPPHPERFAALGVDLAALLAGSGPAQAAAGVPGTHP
jgi:pilus assembly protein CpaF